MPYSQSLKKRDMNQVYAIEVAGTTSIKIWLYLVLIMSVT